MLPVVQVTAAIIVHQGTVLIAQRPAGDRLAGLWEFPGGKIEPGETPEQCLRRELREELGMDAVIGRRFGRSLYPYERFSIELIAYRAFWNGGALRPITHQALRWVAPGRLKDFAFCPADLPFVRRLAAGALPPG